MKIIRGIICLQLLTVLFVINTGTAIADDVDIEFVSHLGGVVEDIVVTDNYAYFGQGQDLVVLDVSDASNPLEVGRITTPSMVWGVDVAGNYAYIADRETGLIIVDITSPSSPTIVGSYDTAGLAYDVDVAGNYAYIAAGTSGLVIVDITSASSPTITSSCSTGSARGIDVASNYAYVADYNNGLIIVDITSPSLPIIAGSSYTSSGNDVDVVGNYAYVASYPNGLVIVNITSPSSPTIASYFYSASSINDVAVVDNYAYVASASGLVIVNISEPTAPKHAGSYDTYGGIGVDIVGNYAYVAAGANGLVIVDISEPKAPMYEASYRTSGYAANINVTDSYAYVANYGYGLTIFNITNPSSPTIASYFSKDITDVAVVDNYAYAANASGLVVVDISNPHLPTLAGYKATNDVGTSVDVADNYAYITNVTGLMIFDISNPHSPTLAGSYDTAGSARRVAVEGNYAYIADYDNGLVIVDISEPTAPKHAGSYDTEGYAYSIAVVDNYAYIADCNNDLEIINISNPSSPTHAGSYDTEGYAYDVDVAGNYAYVAYGSSGLVIVDISEPTAPKYAGIYDTEGSAYGIDVAGNYVYVAATSNGLVILKTNIQNQELANGSLVQVEGNSDVYLIENSMKRHFTSPEALLWNGHSFNEVINVTTETLQNYPDGEDISISQAIIDKYHALGGEPIFGASSGEGEKIGDQDSAGTYCSYVNFKNGSIECFANGPEDNVGNAYAIFDPLRSKWASIGYSKSVLGYPIDNMSNEETSKFGTKFRYQNFANGTEKGALEYNITSGNVFEIHGAIFAKWGALGYAEGIVGLVTSDEKVADTSLQGTTGKYSEFENGCIHWISDKADENAGHSQRGQSFVTYGDLNKMYDEMGGTGSELGFPIMDQEENDGYGYCKFEGGYIDWDDSTRTYKALLSTSPEGSEESIQKMLLALNKNYDYYDAYENHENNLNLDLYNAGNPEKTIISDIEDNDIWMMEYPVSFNLFKDGYKFSLDFNAWYPENSKVPNDNNYRESYIENPLLKNFISTPYLGDTVFYNILTLFETSFESGGLYCRAPIVENYENKPFVTIGQDLSLQIPFMSDVIHHSTGKAIYQEDSNYIDLVLDKDVNLELKEGLPVKKIDAGFYIPDSSFPIGLDDSYIATKLDIKDASLSATYACQLDENNRIDANLFGYNTNFDIDYEAATAFVEKHPNIFTLSEDSLRVEIYNNMQWDQPPCALYELVATTDNFDDAIINSKLTPNTYYNIGKGNFVARLKVPEIAGSSQIYYDVYINDQLIYEKESSAIHKLLFAGYDDLILGDTIVEVRSPVEINLYDSNGNHFGPDQKEIPNALYYEQDHVKTLKFPIHNNKFNLVLNGLDSGTYSMNISRPILVTSPDGSSVITILNYEVNNVTTDTNDLDYFNFDFDEINYNIRENINNGLEIEDAINNVIAALDMDEDGIPDIHDKEMDFNKLKPILIVPEISSENGALINITADLHYLDQKLVEKNVSFYINDNMIGSSKTDQNGTARINYLLSDYLPTNYKIIATFEGDDTFSKVDGSGIIRIINTPPKVEIVNPETSVINGEILVDSKVSDINFKNISLFIDTKEVTNSLPYTWDTTNSEDGIHLIEVIATDELGEQGSDMKLVYTNNNGYIITFVSPITTNNHFNLSDNSILPINFTVRDKTTGEYIYDNSVNVTVVNSTNDILANFNTLNGIQIIPENEEYNINFNTENYPNLLINENYAIIVTFKNNSEINGVSTISFTLVNSSSPSSITNLRSTSGTNWINFTWTNPPYPDFNHTEIYLNNVFQTNTSAEFFNATGLEPETEYTLSTRTVDISGNVNETWINSTATTSAELASDTEKPVIQSAVLYPANTTAGSTINVTVTATDNIDVTGVTAGDIQLAKTDGLWQGSITVPSSVGDYSLLITAKDAAGNTAETTTNYKVVTPTGSLGVGIAPKTTTAPTAGKTIDYTVKIKSIQNFDDIVRVNVTMDGLPASYQISSDWFEWNNKTINIPSNSTVSLPLKLTIPPEQTTGRKAFKVRANSTLWITSAYDSGVITIS